MSPTDTTFDNNKVITDLNFGYCKGLLQKKNDQNKI